MPQIIGIYKLIKDGEVVYIGQSVNCEKRINEHQSRDKKEFDSYQVIVCSKEKLDKLEKEKIEEYQPKYNKEKKEEKINRSYMLEETTLSKLQEIKIKQSDKTYSEILNQAIKYYYKNNYREIK